MKICPLCEKEFGDEISVCPDDGADVMPLISDPLIGSVIEDRYRITAVIGVGSMGVVYRAVQEAVSREVAIKVLPKELASNRQAVKRFHHEAKAASRLNHPHIITVYDFGIAAGGQPFIAMELLDGTTMDRYLLERKRLELFEALPIIQQMCDAIGEAHTQGLIHRDIKPANIALVERGGRKNHVIILDFGIAKGTERVNDPDSTAPGVVFGSPVYMSPERFLGQSGDVRSDIYSLAVVIFQMLSGAVPFKSTDLINLISSHVIAAPPTVSSITSEATIPLAMEQVLQRALSKAPADRPQSMKEFWEEIQRACKPRAAAPNVVADQSVRPLDPTGNASTHDVFKRLEGLLSDSPISSLGAIQQQSGDAQSTIAAGVSAEQTDASAPVAASAMHAASGNVPSADPGQSAVPNTAMPQSGAPQAAMQQSTQAQSAGLQSAPPQSAGPQSTPPQSAGPQSTPPQSAGPQSTPPQSAGPQSHMQASQQQLGGQGTEAAHPVAQPAAAAAPGLSAHEGALSEMKPSPTAGAAPLRAYRSDKSTQSGAPAQSTSAAPMDSAPAPSTEGAGAAQGASSSSLAGNMKPGWALEERGGAQAAPNTAGAERPPGGRRIESGVRGGSRLPSQFKDNAEQDSNPSGRFSAPSFASDKSGDSASHGVLITLLLVGVLLAGAAIWGIAMTQPQPSPKYVQSLLSEGKLDDAGHVLALLRNDKRGDDGEAMDQLSMTLAREYARINRLPAAIQSLQQIPPNSSQYETAQQLIKKYRDKLGI